MKKEDFVQLCKKHNANTIFKNQVERTPVGAYWDTESVDDIPDEKNALPVVFDIGYPISPDYLFGVRAYAPENWFPKKFSFREYPF